MLTAARCLWDAHTDGTVAPGELHFLAGYRRGDSGSPLLMGEGDRLQRVGVTTAVADDGRHGASIVIDASVLSAGRAPD